MTQPDEVAALRAALAEREQRIGEITRAVRDWICEGCRTVYPGPPGPKSVFVRCPRCGTAAVPLYAHEMAQARKLSADLSALLAEPDDPCLNAPLGERLVLRVAELVRERAEARSGEIEAREQVERVEGRLREVERQRDELAAAWGDAGAALQAATSRCLRS